MEPGAGTLIRYSFAIGLKTCWTSSRSDCLEFGKDGAGVCGCAHRAIIGFAHGARSARGASARRAARAPCRRRAESAPEAEALWRAQVRAGTATSPRAACSDTGRSFYTIGSAGHESNAARRARAAADRPGAAALPLRRLLPRARRRRRGATACPTSCAASPPRATSRSRAAGTRSSATTSSRSSRRPRRSPRTCRARSASRSRSSAAKKLGVESPWPPDAVVVCSFGDASLNHATAQAALNSAAHTALPAAAAAAALRLRGQRARDQRAARRRAGSSRRCARGRQLRYEAAAGDDPEAVLETARELAEWVRDAAAPGVLHLRTVRFLEPRGRRRRGRLPHAAGDPRRLGRRPAARDRALARRAAGGAATAGDEYLADARARSRSRATRRRALPQLESAAEVMRAARAAHGPRRRRAGRQPPSERAGDARAGDQRRARRGARARPERARSSARTSPSRAASTASRAGCRSASAPGRVFDTLLDETSILGLALGAAVSGLPAGAGDPVPRLPAQRRGPAARRGGDAAVLLAGPVPERHGRADRGLRLPEGLRRPLPQRRRGRRAARHPRARDRLARRGPTTPRRCCATCLAPARVDGSVCVFLEPIALYHTRDLYEDGDERLARAPTAGDVAARRGAHLRRRRAT